jgi:hypothetical protein
MYTKSMYTKSMYTKSMYTKSMYTKSMYFKSMYTKCIPKVCIPKVCIQKVCIQKVCITKVCIPKVCTPVKGCVNSDTRCFVYKIISLPNIGGQTKLLRKLKSQTSSASPEIYEYIFSPKIYQSSILIVLGCSSK